MRVAVVVNLVLWLWVALAVARRCASCTAIPQQPSPLW